MSQKKRFKSGEKVRYTQVLFDLGSPEDTLYGKVGQFLDYDPQNDSKCFVGFPGLPYASHVEAIALERV